MHCQGELVGKNGEYYFPENLADIKWLSIRHRLHPEIERYLSKLIGLVKTLEEPSMPSESYKQWFWTQGANFQATVNCRTVIKIKGLLENLGVYHERSQNSKGNPTITFYKNDNTLIDFTLNRIPITQRLRSVFTHLSRFY